MATNYPIVAYDNLLGVLPVYTITSGTDNTAAPISNACNNDKLRPAFPVADALGALVIEFSFTTSTAAQCLILGADRHDAAGYKTAVGSFALEYWNGAAWVSLIAATALSAVNTSTIYKLATHTLGLSGAVYKYRLSYSGLAALSTVAIPELFLGTYLELPPVDYGFDEYNEIYKGSKFESLSGRIYKTLHFRRIELSPHWSIIERTQDTAINLFRETCLELLKPFWFAWFPDALPNEVYHVMHDGTNAAYPIKSSVHRTFALKLIEVI